MVFPSSAPPAAQGAGRVAPALNGRLLRWWSVSALVIVLTVVLYLVFRRDSAPAQAGPQPTAETVAAAKLLVETEGIYEVDAAALAAIGFDLVHADATDLAMSLAGQAVAFQLVGEGANRAVRFYAEAAPLDSYSGQSVYWLADTGAAGDPDVAAPDGGVAASVPLVARTASGVTEGVAEGDAVTESMATLRLEEQRRYEPQAPPGHDRWMWESLFAPAEVAVSLPTPHLAAGEAMLILHIYGNSSGPPDPDHHLLATLNGAPVLDATWDGPGPHTITATVPANVLTAGDNQLSLQAPGDTGAVVDALFLDWVTLHYPRQLVVEAGALTFSGSAAGYRVEADAPPVAVWDVTDPMRPILIQDFEATAAGIRFAAEEAAAGGAPARYALATAQGLRSPAAMIPVTGPDLREWPGGADLIIVTTPAFRATLAPLVAAREADGLRVALVDVAAVYNTFSYGETDPAAIRALVKHAVANWPAPAPRFLLLAGDASYDPRGYLGGDELDLVPTRLVNTSFSGWTASDVWYALPDDSPAARPLLAVGRFPAQTAAQLAVMVEKTLAYEQGAVDASWREQALLVADNDEPGFAAEATAFAAGLQHYSADVLQIEDDGAHARAEIRAAIENGVGLLGYFGHGSLSLWAKEKVFAVEDVPALSNGDRLPIVFTVTCLSGLFQHPSAVSLSEALLRKPDGGVVAALVPSSAALLSDQRLLAQGLAAALNASVGEPLGEIIHQAQLSLPARAGGIQEILLTFNLLGDPTLKLSR